MKKKIIIDSCSSCPFEKYISPGKWRCSHPASADSDEGFMSVCPLEDDNTEKLRDALNKAAITIRSWQKAQWPSCGVEVMTIEDIVKGLLEDE